MYTCVQAPCMSVSEAAAAGQTSMCRMTEQGCYVSIHVNVTSKDLHIHSVVLSKCLIQFEIHIQLIKLHKPVIVLE